MNFRPIYLAVLAQPASEDTTQYAGRLYSSGRGYLKIDNLTDEQVIVSRRPFGARPNKPRQASIGFKYSF